MTRRFKIQIHDLIVPGIPEIPKYWINVTVYDDIKDMHRAMAKVDGKPLASYSTEDGVVGGGWAMAEKAGHNGYLGILRLVTEHLNDENLIHESVHVGVSVAQTFFGCDPLRLPIGGTGTREEVVAYASSTLAATLIRHLL